MRKESKGFKEENLEKSFTNAERVILNNKRKEMKWSYIKLIYIILISVCVIHAGIYFHSSLSRCIIIAIYCILFFIIIKYKPNET